MEGEKHGASADVPLVAVFFEMASWSPKIAIFLRLPALLSALQTRVVLTPVQKRWKQYVKTGTGCKALAKTFGISRTALLKRKKKGVMNPKRGAPTHFSATTETAMAEYIISLANTTNAFTRKSFMRWAEHFSMTRLNDGKFEATEGWLRGFLRRNKRVVNRCVTKQTRSRLESFNRVAVLPWAVEIAAIAATFDAASTWNCDATGNTMKMGQKKVCGRFSVIFVVSRAKISKVFLHSLLAPPPPLCRRWGPPTAPLPS